VRSGISSLTWENDTFAYAAAYDADSKRYLGLVAGQLGDVVLDASAVLVKPPAAAEQLSAGPGTGGPGPGGPGPGPGPGGPGAGPGPEPEADPTRFYGRVTLEPVRLLRDVGQIAEALVAHLDGPAGSRVSITVEIQAESEDGFPQTLRRTVSENARTLKFETSEFEP
jgi:hypothetical protein